MSAPGENRLDGAARRLASGMSRRDALRLGGAAFAAALTGAPADAWAALTRRCPPHRASCHGVCCPKGEVCLPPKHKGGKHRCGCPAHKHRCGSKCVDIHTDHLNCGGCGHACAAGQTCVAGRCTTGCPAGETLCAGACVTLARDPHNCGACGTVCPSGMVCANGACVSSCPAGQTSCAGACVDLSGDPSHCGSCATTCTGGQVCVNGACACPAGETFCNGTCVNTQTDVNNCGGCGVKCSTCFATSSCASGTCHIDSCAPNWVNCSGNPLDGCNCLGTTCPAASCPGCPP